MIANVRYETSIYCTVDTDTGTVLSVQVMDENLSPVEAVGEMLEPIGFGEQHEAIRIAEQAIWPSWTFGW